MCDAAATCAQCMRRSSQVESLGLGHGLRQTDDRSKTARQQDSKTARQQDSKTARQQDSKTARQQDSKTARQQDSKTARQQGSRQQDSRQQTVDGRRAVFNRATS
ncbi:uncharacterized protein UV8b_02591 [Ustilaginoidea virens]|uniref:Uncharacterized protein n=1 Tax=Ustilaginoidea virens TaxID=1159556 RepID=A0A8E5HMT2_USTVR|nr:uncharacterized protein UV8b_02591 [Ustilaginoidea virens]QUC18350.1 hypothetical protein UV8b_02591 [Ustilaginoidea virens]